MKKHLLITVTGRVQNVGFRYYTHKKALEYSVSGYVMNCPDGSVYIEAEADGPNLQTFLEWLRKGPSWARITEVMVTEAPLAEFALFEIR